MNEANISERLLWLARELGREERHFSILGEGNVTADLGDGTFLVKASGSELRTLDGSGLTRVKMDPVFSALANPDKKDEEVRAVLENSRVDAKAKLPSVETFLHAICLREGGARWIGHTHTVSVLKVLCSRFGVEPFRRHIFPDAIVVCGRRLVVVPYVDPGIKLAVVLREALRDFMNLHGAAPKVILMANHGPVALGQSEREVLNIMLMLDKWASVLSGVLAIGEPRFLDEELSDRIEHRPDEHYRRAQIGQLKP
jgi:rhamnose utilization protein RhaD (predicted bifunctional aldolase and dehydrogenase)